MILFTNDTAKGFDNEVSYRLPRTGYGADSTDSAARTAPRKAEDARLLAGMKQAVRCIAVCAFTLSAITIIGIFLSLAPSLTGQGQEAQGGQWRGAKLTAREARP